MLVTLAYATMQGVAKRKTTIPILSNLLVEARDGRVTIISRMWAGKSDPSSR
jgi:DNA polymerase III sliding clamp (beta) subunit (PCNA family)